MPNNANTADLQLESFAAWVLAAQIGSAVGVGGGAPPPQTTAQAAAQATRVSPGVQNALELLKHLNISVTGYNIIETSTIPPHASKGEIAFSYRNLTGQRNIYIGTWTPIYKLAQRPPNNAQELGAYRDAAKMLAAVIVHEMTHIDDGPTVSNYDTEQHAYDAELNILHKLRANSSTIHNVEMAKKLTLQQFSTAVTPTSSK